MFKELRKKLRNIKRRKFVREAGRLQFEIDTALWWAQLNLDRAEEAFKRLDKLEKHYKKNQKRSKDVTNKTAGRNTLRPRLGK